MGPVNAPYLVAYEYGQGAVWAFVHAESASRIEIDFPELTVVRERPPWMTPEDEAKIAEVHTYHLEDTPVGLLAEIIDARDAPDC